MTPADPSKIPRPNGAEPVDVWKARRFIEQSSDDELSLSKVAKVVSVSPNHLSEKFKQVTGINFVDYVARIRYEKALSLLHNLDLRVSEIAFGVGFQSLSQFNRVFKKLAGTSPTQVRMALSKPTTTAKGVVKIIENRRKNALPSG